MIALTSHDVANWLNIVLSETGEASRVKAIEASEGSVTISCTEPFTSIDRVYRAIARQSVNARITVRKQYVLFTRKAQQTGQAYGGDW